MVYIKKKTNQSALEERRQKARDLYGTGFTMREVGDIMKKSRQWVHNAVKKPSPLDKVLTPSIIKETVDKQKGRTIK